MRIQEVPDGRLVESISARFEKLPLSAALPEIEQTMVSGRPSGNYASPHLGRKGWNNGSHSAARTLRSHPLKIWQPSGGQEALEQYGRGLG